MKTNARVDIKLLEFASTSEAFASVTIEDLLDQFYVSWTVTNAEGTNFGGKSFGISKRIVNGLDIEDFLVHYITASINKARSDRKYLFIARNWVWFE